MLGTALPRPVTTIYEKRAAAGRWRDWHRNKPRRTEQGAVHTPLWGIERSGKEYRRTKPDSARTWPAHLEQFSPTLDGDDEYVVEVEPVPLDA